MTMIFNATWASLVDSEYLVGKPVELDDFEDLIERLHYCYANSGTWFGGRVFNPEWTTTTTASYVTATGGSGDTDLNMFHPTGVFLRSVDGGGYEVEVRAYGRNVEIEVTPIRYDAGGPNTGANVPAAFTLSTSTGDSEWFSGTSSLTANNISLEGSSANDPAVFGFAIAAKKVGANDARIYMIDVAEKRADSGDIPTS